MNHSPSERLIVALDFSDVDEARKCVDELDGIVNFYKIGLELFTAPSRDFLNELRERQCRIFLDLKMHDVDETIRRAVANVASLEVDFLTIHGNSATLQAACSGKTNHRLRLLAVPLLSSWNEKDLQELFLVGPAEGFIPRFDTLDEYVFWRADQAIAQGCDGLIASGAYVGRLRERFGKNVLLVSPGIRPSGLSTDEHKRSLTPRKAIQDGADYIVVGRPIRDAMDRKAMAQRIIEEIDSAI
ncbi:MAG: orotidine-5'-phosphate decarboxylase [Nitrospirales bacterium]|nr:orotidine-5'-phosphate decarboxylase [Nitrospira sp.]MDR4501065.1 orotidine-5'-phosphate decarboxylase [Nitrospirales bacterium]